MERYDGDAERVALELVDAANEASGKDNISVVFVAGPEFLGSDSESMHGGQGPTCGHSNAAQKQVRSCSRAGFPWLVAGILLGMMLWAVAERSASNGVWRTVARSSMLHDKRFGRYEILRKLGRSMTDVYLALDEEAGRTSR